MNTTNNHPDITLRQWYVSDRDALCDLVRRADHRLTDGFLPSTLNENEAHRWIIGMVDSLVYGDELHYAVEYNGQVVGCINLSRWGDDFFRTGTLRILLMPEACHRGIGTEAGRQLLAKAFRCQIADGLIRKGLFERVHAEVFGDNLAAMHVLEHNGFVHEGTMRQAAYKDGQTYDIQVYAKIFQPTPSQDDVISKAEVLNRIRMINQMLKGDPQ